MTRRGRILAFFGILFAAAAVGTVPPAGAQPTEIGEVIIGFEAGALPGVAAGDTIAGLTVRKLVPRGSFVVVAAPDLGLARRAVAGVPGVSYVEDNALLHALTTPNDPRYGDQYGPGMMGFPDAWDDVGFGSSDAVVAVLDTGLQKTHSDFEASRIRQGHDYSNGDSNPNDDCGHGTHVAGTVAATTDNATGVAGMSQATILPMKVLSPLGLLITITCSGSTADIAEAIIDSTDQGAHVVSMSLGGGGASNTMQNAVDYAWNNGVLVVAAAGNDGPCTNCVSYPAKYPNAIAVSAVGPNKSIASYSSVGPEIEVAAPGSSVWSTYNNGGYRSLSGTSMATPHVSGALALALSCDPSASAATLRNLLHTSAEDLGANGRDATYGYGLARIDTLVDLLGGCGGGGDPGNAPPTASFEAVTDGLTVTVDASASDDPDGDPLSYAWTFGDGTGGSGVTAAHTYAASGTYVVGLTVSDGNGGSDVATRSVSVSDGSTPPDPDPATPNLESGQPETVTLSGTGDDEHYKIFVPAGSERLLVTTDGPACGLLSCPFDADLYVRFGERATDQDWACRPFRSGNEESCAFDDPNGGWWYVRVKSYRGNGQVTLTGAVTP